MHFLYNESMRVMPTIDEINAAENPIFDLPDWQPEHAKQLGEKIIDICIEAKEKEGLNLSTLKCISIRESEDFAPSVNSWQRELGIPEIVTSMESGGAGGKAMSWKTPLGETRSGIILSEIVAVGIVKDIPFFKGVITHELAHIHDDAHRFKFDSQTTPASALSLPELLHDLTHTLWSEYFADKKASRHYDEESIQSNAGNSDMIKELLDIHSQQKSAYHTHQDRLQFWQETLSATSVSIAVIGRFLGQLPDNNLELMKTFEKCLPSDGWKKLTSDALPLLSKIYYNRKDWDLDDLKTLDPIVFAIWNEFGVFPEPMKDNVFLLIR